MDNQNITDQLLIEFTPSRFFRKQPMICIHDTIIKDEIQNQIELIN